MNNPHQLTYTLRQHTPMIHFQWHEEGATIRPTELKSKLDKWIIGKTSGCWGIDQARLSAVKNHTTNVNGKERHILKEWLKGLKDSDKIHPALDYTVRIRSLGQNLFKDVMNIAVEYYTDNNGNPKSRLTDGDYAPFFGNQMKVEDFEFGKKLHKRMTFFQTLQVTFSSNRVDLIKEIQDTFPHFILHTNFGTRQGKGFGSFFIDNHDSNFPYNYEQIFKEQFDWWFDLDLGKDEHVNMAANKKEKNLQERLFHYIDNFYKTLRSGISPHDKPNMYFKSLMWAYAKSLNRQWEKKTIKEVHFNSFLSAQQGKYIDPDNPTQWTGSKDFINKNGKRTETHFLWRDLLGLASEQTWKGYPAGGKVNKSSIRTDVDKPMRFMSPIFFKPLRTGETSFRVFFAVPTHTKKAFKTMEGRTNNDVPELAILGQWFNITGSSSTLQLPYPEIFDYDAFMTSIFSMMDSMALNNWVRNGNHITLWKNDRISKELVSESKNKTHGQKVFDKKHRKDVPNPDFLTLTAIFSQLNAQAKAKKP